ncbi:MAG: hypothetical protein KJ879_03675 [Nanoarchaeota archaeon]|nr:hypothetical protein [Nanoarchaeota archaeon]
MKDNQKFENILNQIRQDNQEELKTMSLLDYVKTNIDANQYWFFNADTDDEVEILNNQFVKYVESFVIKNQK